MFKVETKDALSAVEQMEACSVDAIITDPPYAATGSSSSYVSYGEMRGIPREYQFYEAWLREHLRQWQRVLKPDGALWMTLDWRGAMALDQASNRLGLGDPKIGIWYRRGLGMGNVLRNVYECFAVLPMVKWQRIHTDEPDLWDIKWTPSLRKHGHSAEKPVDLMRRACRLLTKPGSIILDPFTGSGSTGVAAILEGMDFLGFEREPEFAKLAASRMETAQDFVKVHGLRSTVYQTDIFS